jgi:hypothetical protein
MNHETKKLFNERILTFINRYLKHGAIVQKNWGFFARGDLEKMIGEAYIQGRIDAEKIPYVANTS